jgi:MoxR-like ATPase
LEQELEMVARHDAGMNPHDVRGSGVRAVASAADLAAGRAAIQRHSSGAGR